MTQNFKEPYVRAVRLDRAKIDSPDRYPFAIPAIRHLEELELHPQVTFLIGENGSGKSTLIEAIAIAAGFNAEGGSRNFRFATRRSESDLAKAILLVRGTRRPKDGFFLRAESYFNVGTEIERLDSGEGGEKIVDSFGGVSIHEQSHGESFLRLATHRFHGNGFYVLDELEAAVSPTRQLSFLAILDKLVQSKDSQFVIATHSPILMAYPSSRILRLDPDGPREVAFRDTEHYRITKEFLADPERYLRRLFTGE
jgi:predicted ATPase